MAIYNYFKTRWRSGYDRISDAPSTINLRIEDLIESLGPCLEHPNQGYYYHQDEKLALIAIKCSLSIEENERLTVYAHAVAVGPVADSSEIRTALRDALVDNYGSDPLLIIREIVKNTKGREKNETRHLVTSLSVNKLEDFEEGGVEDFVAPPSKDARAKGYDLEVKNGDLSGKSYLKDRDEARPPRQRFQRLLWDATLAAFLLLFFLSSSMWLQNSLFSQRIDAAIESKIQSEYGVSFQDIVETKYREAFSDLSSEDAELRKEIKQATQEIDDVHSDLNSVKYLSRKNEAEIQGKTVQRLDEIDTYLAILDGRLEAFSNSQKSDNAQSMDASTLQKGDNVDDDSNQSMMRYMRLINQLKDEIEAHKERIISLENMANNFSANDQSIRLESGDYPEHSSRVFFERKMAAVYVNESSLVYVGDLMCAIKLKRIGGLIELQVNVRKIGTNVTVGSGSKSNFRYNDPLEVPADGGRSVCFSMVSLAEVPSRLGSNKGLVSLTVSISPRKSSQCM